MSSIVLTSSEEDPFSRAIQRFINRTPNEKLNPHAIKLNRAASQRKQGKKYTVHSQENYSVAAICSYFQQMRIPLGWHLEQISSSQQLRTNQLQINGVKQLSDLLKVPFKLDFMSYEGLVDKLTTRITDEPSYRKLITLYPANLGIREVFVDTAIKAKLDESTKFEIVLSHLYDHILNAPLIEGVRAYRDIANGVQLESYAILPSSLERIANKKWFPGMTGNYSKSDLIKVASFNAILAKANQTFVSYWNNEPNLEFTNFVHLEGLADELGFSIKSSSPNEEASRYLNGALYLTELLVYLITSDCSMVELFSPQGMYSTSKIEEIEKKYFAKSQLSEKMLETIAPSLSYFFDMIEKGIDNHSIPYLERRRDKDSRSKIIQQNITSIRDRYKLQDKSYMGSLLLEDPAQRV